MVTLIHCHLNKEVLFSISDWRSRENYIVGGVSCEIPKVNIKNWLESQDSVLRYLIGLLVIRTFLGDMGAPLKNKLLDVRQVYLEGMAYLKIVGHH